MTKLETISLRLGVAIPFLYFGSVALGALFYPGFSFVRQFASELGADEAPRPRILNTGLMLLGVVSLASVFGFWRALQRVGSNPIPVRWTVIVLTGFAVAMFMGGYFPMNNYLGHSGFGLSFLLLAGPALLAAGLSNRTDTRSLRIYLLGTNVLIVVMFAANLLVGKTEFNGLFQLTYTLLAIPWIGVAAYSLSRLAGKDVGGAAA